MPGKEIYKRKRLWQWWTGIFGSFHRYYCLTESWVDREADERIVQWLGFISIRPTVQWTSLQFYNNLLVSVCLKGYWKAIGALCRPEFLTERYKSMLHGIMACLVTWLIYLFQIPEYCATVFHLFFLAELLCSFFCENFNGSILQKWNVGTCVAQTGNSKNCDWLIRNVLLPSLLNTKSVFMIILLNNIWQLSSALIIRSSAKQNPDCVFFFF